MAARGTQINPDKFHKSQLKFHFILVPLSILMILPIIYIIATAFKPIDELFAFPPTILVKNPTLDNFRDLFAVSSTSSVPVSRYVFNSIVITVVVVFFSIISSSMAGFALSKLDFKGKKLLFEINQLAIMFVAAAVAIPKYLLLEKLGLLDTFWVHVLPVLAIPVGLFLIKQFIDQVPNEIIEAAHIDGATDFSIYWNIILPVIKPAIATVAILAFQTIWNDAVTSQIYVNSESLKTFAYYMGTLSGTAGTIAGQGITAAATLFMFLPNLIIFIIMQSQVMSTVAHSGIK